MIFHRNSTMSQAEFHEAVAYVCEMTGAGYDYVSAHKLDVTFTGTGRQVEHANICMKLRL